MSSARPGRRRLPRLRRLLGYGAAALVIVAGLAVATLSQLLPLLAREPQAVADWLSDRAGRPVQVTALQARWDRRGPRFDLDGLSIGSGDERIHVGRAALQLDLYLGLLPGQPLASIQLDGLALTLEHGHDRRWRLHGSDPRAAFDLAQLEQFGELVIDRASLTVSDLPSGQQWTLPRFDARLRSVRGQLQFAAAAYAGQGAPLRVTGEFDPAQRSGRLHAKGEQLDLDQWLGGIELRGLSLAAGTASADVWLQVEDGAVTGGEFELPQATLQLASEAVSAAGPIRIEPPPLSGRFARIADGWTLGIDAGNGAWLRLQQSGTLRQIEAGGLEVAALRELLAAASEDAAALSGQLRAADLRGRIETLRAELDGSALTALRLRVEQLAGEPVGERPGFSGLSLAAHWQEGQLALSVDSPGFTVHWPAALREPLAAALLGELSAMQIDGFWQLDTGQLAVRGPDFAFDIAGLLRFDGGRPSADLRVAVHDAPIVAAKRFWIRNRMPATAVAWLDESLIDGRLGSGQVLLHGDLDDWPFADQQGRLVAEAQVEDVTLRYRPDWPVATALGGRAVFLNRSIEVDVEAEVLGNRVQRAHGSIASLRDPRLLLDISGNGSGPDLLNLLRRSPLQDKYRDSLQSLQIGGQADVVLQLDIPLVKRLGQFAMRGSAELVEADLRDARWGIALDAAEGTLRFTERGLDAEDISVLYSGQPARFSVALGSHTAAPTNAVETSLRGRIDADTLLDVQPALNWLKPYMDGASEWQIEVQVPTVPGAATLRIASDLVGTTLSLPAPLSKAAAVRLPLTAEVGLQASQADGASPLDLRLGGLLRLQGVFGDEARFNGVAAFGETAAVERPPEGLRVVGQVPVIDASAWAAMAAGSATGDGTVVDVDLFAGELGLLDRGFAETRLRLDRPQPGELRLRFDGPALDGVIEVPAAEQRAERGITARLQRLHWPAPRGGSALTDLIDPADVPAFHLWVKELRLGDANLGETRLETFPQDSGMRVDLFESRSSALQLFGRGDWTRKDGRSRSSFELEFTAAELGGMLQALGFSELIEGGQTFAKMRADWPGPPAAFAMEQVEGTLEINVGEGRVPQVNPGAGRLLGLFSLTEIPRRLSLDFSDFFRAGLAFNSIAGSFIFSGGNAVTENLVIDSPAAEIRILGRTGLKAKDYDQTMEVLPRTGSVLPVVGAIAGGPAGAAIGAVAQAMLQRPFKYINRTLYRVEGPWSAPVLEVLERGPARTEPGP